jgi:hypothetical protein
MLPSELDPLGNVFDEQHGGRAQVSLHQALHVVSSQRTGWTTALQIMMDHLQCSMDAAGKALVTTLKTMKLNEIEGENVDRIDVLVRTTIQQLGKIRHSLTGSLAIPDDLSKSLIAVLKTSTVKQFTASFEHLETKALANKYANGGMTNTYPPVNILLDIAHNTLYDMSLANTWTGVKMKAKQTAFPASVMIVLTCWNCGGPHTWRNCKVARDQKKIDENKRKAAAAKAKGQGKAAAAKAKSQGGCGCCNKQGQGHGHGGGQGGYGQQEETLPN